VSVIDPARSTCLCDVGRPDYLAATAVAADGSNHLLLAHVDDIGDESVTYNHRCPDAPHEQPGPLPPQWGSRVLLARLRCGRPTKTTGQPCRIEVTRPGAPCGLHRTAAHR
jgi:hypothetical protein